MRSKSVLPVTVPVTRPIGDIADVEASLTDLYLRTIGEEGESSEPIIKTALTNLVVFSHDETQTEAVAEKVGQLVGVHPCRAIIVEDVPLREGEAPAIASLVCDFTERGDRRLCGDVVRMRVPGLGRAVVGAVLPLLMPDLPVFLWSPEGLPLDDEEFAALLANADDLVFDSRLFGALRESLCRVTAMSPRLILRDMAWQSLYCWREMVAEHFDDPAARDYLPFVHSIAIRYAVPAHNRLGAGACPPSPPLLLAAWFVDRLRLTNASLSVLSETNWEISVSGGAGGDSQAVITVSTVESDVPQGFILDVTIQAGNGGKPAVFRTLREGSNEITVEQNCPGVCYPPRTVHIDPQHEYALAASLLEGCCGDAAYMDALNVAVGLLRCLEGEDSKRL